MTKLNVCNANADILYGAVSITEILHQCLDVSRHQPLEQPQIKRTSCKHAMQFSVLYHCNPLPHVHQDETRNQMAGGESVYSPEIPLWLYELTVVIGSS